MSNNLTAPTPTLARADASQRAALKRAERLALAYDLARDSQRAAEEATERARADLAAALEALTRSLTSADLGAAAVMVGQRQARLEATYRPATISTIPATERRNKARRVWALVIVDPDGAERRIRCELADQPDGGAQ